MKRRAFIRQTLSSSAFIAAGGLGLQSFSSNGSTRITILHTNDVHSHIDPFGPEDGRNANKGGIARRAKLIESIRRENPNNLLFDA
ncbi:MAG: bifunctional metallophosphatase/5'-nucleotidase, partial [Flavobacteriaceae bacterium]|nr:bifunctional metallophosphatase/5'-nucleotidase [Flavobacteriaceae bacterium]